QQLQSPHRDKRSVHGALVDAHPPAKAGTGTIHGVTTCAPSPDLGEELEDPAGQFRSCERDPMFDNTPPAQLFPCEAGEVDRREATRRWGRVGFAEHRHTQMWT